MKYQKLKQIINEEAHNLKECAAYQGASNDGGSTNLLNKLESFKRNLIYKYDLKPSEYSQLNDIEIGEPEEFSKIIKNYKIKLVEQYDINDLLDLLDKDNI